MSEIVSSREHPADAAWLKQRSASPGAIAAHYDVGNAFFALWLDPELLYTCAAWPDGADPDDLAAAQRNKIDFYAAALGVKPGARVLDIGCGWGGALRRLSQAHGAAAVGLTLSPSQHAYVRRDPQPGIEIDLCNWIDYEPAAPFDAIISLEAIEAFACQGLARAEKVKIYRALFERAHAWLRPGGHFGLQMIAYGSTGPENFDRFIAESIFPESDLPRLSEVIEASEGLFETVSLRNDRHDYVRTLRLWLRGLKANRARARTIVGAPVVTRFEDYLRLSWHMFATGACDLHRIVFRRIDARAAS